MSRSKLPDFEGSREAQAGADEGEMSLKREEVSDPCAPPPYVRILRFSIPAGTDAMDEVNAKPVYRCAEMG